MQNDVVIIGAGPVGLFAAFAFGMHGMKVTIVDNYPQPGGQCQALYPEKPIFDIPAWPKITGGQLIEQLMLQNQRFSPHYKLGHTVRSIKKLAERLFHIVTDQEELYAQAIVLATGSGIFTPVRPNIMGIEKLEGISVFYHIDNIERFANKNVVIAGGGDSAVDWALALYDVANKIYLVHRRDKFKAHQYSIDALNKCSDKIEKIIPFVLHDIVTEDEQMIEVIVRNLHNQEVRLPADNLLAFFGLHYDNASILDWPIQIENGVIPVTASNMKTNLEGIFAIGDAADYPGKLKLIMTGFAEASIAAKSAFHYLFPDKIYNSTHSTSKL